MVGIEGIDSEAALQGIDSWDGVVPPSVTRLFIGHRDFDLPIQTIDIPDSVLHLSLSNGVKPVKWPTLSQRSHRLDFYNV
jgi:hypothetical protein